MPSGSLSIERLKSWAIRNLPRDSVLREILLRERNELSAEELLGRIEVWSMILQHDQGTRATKKEGWPER